VSVGDPSLAGHLAALLAPFATGGEPAHLYAIASEGGSYPLFRLYLDDEEVFNAQQVHSVFAHLLWHINRQVIEASSSTYLLLHAAVAELAGRAVLLPASAGSGKTTLVAGLVQAGLRYMSDEVAAIDPRTGLVHPFPKPLSVEPGSWGALAALRPNVAEELEVFNVGQWQVRADDIRPRAVAGPCHPATVITPRYVAGATAALIPQSRADAVAMMVANSFNFREYGSAGLRVLAEVARASACCSLTFGDLNEACRLVLEAASASSPGIGRA
jgi:hypothetical protein